MTLPPLNIAYAGIGLDAYWPQFPGLKEKLEADMAVVAAKLARPDLHLVQLGLIDNVDSAYAAGHICRREEVDLIFLHATTYALSSTVLPMIRRAKVPVVVLNLSPLAAIPYEKFNRSGDRRAMTGEWLGHCGSCPVPEIANVLTRARLPFFQITGQLHHDPKVWHEINLWVNAAKVAHVMSHNRLGVMGHYYGGMLDIYSDLTLQSAAFGTHIEMIEVDQLSALRRQVSDAQVSDRIALFHSEFDVQADCSAEELTRAARTSVALERLVAEKYLGSMAYYYMGTGIDENEETLSSIILGNSLLTARGCPVAGELEIKNVQAMKILDILGAGGSFTEYYAVDWTDDVILMGHDGPVISPSPRAERKCARSRCITARWGEACQLKCR